MRVEDILLLGDPRLYQVCEDVYKEELDMIDLWVEKMHMAMEDIRRRFGFGRAIAAPQLGIMKRLIYMNIEDPIIIINPTIVYKSNEMMEVWDDCMSLPNLLVKVSRHQNIRIDYLDQDWNKQSWHLEDDLSELLQHEMDHLDGILCTMRAINNKSFKWRP